MPTHPIGEGLENVSITITAGLAQRLKALAHASGMSRSAYCRRLLIQHAERETRVTTTYELSQTAAPMYAETPRSAPPAPREKPKGGKQQKP